MYAFFDHAVLLAMSVFVRQVPHATIELIAYDNHTRLSAPEIFRIWRPGLIVRDKEGSPVYGIQYGINEPKLAVPPEIPVSFEMLWPIPGFGKILLAVDNQGRGYSTPENGVVVVELLPEFARSRLAQVRDWVNVHNSGRYTSDKAQTILTQASSIVERLDEFHDQAERAAHAMMALQLELRAGELEVLAEARQTISQRRRGIVRIQVEDSHGQPVKSAHITATQRQFDFLFGVFSDGYDQNTIERLQAIGTNYAMLFMTWNRMEPVEDNFSFDTFDFQFNPSLLQKNGFTTCGHAMVWLAKDEVPEYISKMRGNPGQLETAVRRHVSTIVSKYKDQIQIWEAMNEGHPTWSRWGLNDSGLIRLVRASLEEIRKAAPQAKTMVEVTMPLGEDVALKYYPFVSTLSKGRIGADSSEAFQYLKHLNEAGIDYDILALQVYNGAIVNVGNQTVQVPAIDIFRFARELERYSTLGKPIQIAEIAVGSSAGGHGLSSWWHSAPSEETQADYLEDIFTLAYGNLNVQAVNWWGFNDKYRFVENGGIEDSSGRAKVAAKRLAQLLRTWRTDGELITDAAGRAIFSGASGDYSIAVRNGNRSVRTQAHISQGMTDELVVRLP